MSDTDTTRTVTQSGLAENPVPEASDLLSDPQFRDRFEQTSAALEAAHLVRQMRRQALSASGVRGITQDELAQRTGLTQPRISQIEKGTGRDGISYALLRKIAYACGIDWGRMVNDTLAAEFATAPQSSAQGPAAVHTDAQTKEGYDKAVKSAEKFAQFQQANLEAFVKSSHIFATGLTDLSKHVATTSRANVEGAINNFCIVLSLKEALELKEALDMQVGVDEIRRLAAQTGDADPTATIQRIWPYDPAGFQGYKVTGFSGTVVPAPRKADDRDDAAER